MVLLSGLFPPFQPRIEIRQQGGLVRQQQFPLLLQFGALHLHMQRSEFLSLGARVGALLHFGIPALVLVRLADRVLDVSNAGNLQQKARSFVLEVPNKIALPEMLDLGSDRLLFPLFNILQIEQAGEKGPLAMATSGFHLETRMGRFHQICRILLH